jgi:hypothetical protein
MSAVLTLLALSALIGFALGNSFSWIAILISGVVLAIASAAALRIQGFDALFGIAIIGACLTVNQTAYLAGGFFAHRRSEGLFEKQADKEPGQRRDTDIAGERHQQQKTPSWFA